MKVASRTNTNSSQGRKRKMKRQSSVRSHLRKQVSFSSHVSHKKRLTSITKQQGENIKTRPKLPVTCEDKEGILHKDRFNKGSRKDDGKMEQDEEEGDKEKDHDDNYDDEEEEKEDEKEDNGEGVDLSTFDPPALPVSCGSVSGFLYKSRFAGVHSKSIRTEERWFTPEEFVKQESTFTDRIWMENILCHGKTLNYLVKKKILRVHLQLCPCRVCHPKNNFEQDNDDECYICKIDEKLVYCDACPRAFHHDCHLPTLQEDTPGDAWTCTFCNFKSKQRLWNHISRKDALSSPVSGDTILRCEYLLLHLFTADRERVFAGDPNKRVRRYSSVISNPMWLDKVKNKLQKNKYRKVEQFVNDIELIFNNCRTFNRDNMYGKIGIKMKNMLEEEFNTIFKIQ